MINKLMSEYFGLFFPLALLLALTFNSACISSPPLSPLSKNKEASILANNAGKLAYADEHYKEALDNYLEALRLSRSIEDLDGIAINLINISSTYEKMGDYVSAYKYVDKIIFPSQVGFNEKYVVEALYLKSTLLISQDMYDPVPALIDEALIVCSRLKCKIEGKLYNLMSKGAFLSGKYDDALMYAKKAMPINEKYAELKETANSFRFMARASTKLQKYKDASAFYNKALLLDKKLGLSFRIEADLMGLGFLFFEQEKNEIALNYFKRALSVSASSFDGEVKNEEVKEMIRRCQEKISDRL